MIITDYRVKSVLRTYAKQLQRAKLQKKDSSTPSSSTEKVTISEEAKKQLIFMGLSNQALEKANKENKGTTENRTVKEETKNSEKSENKSNRDRKSQGV